MSDPDTGNSQKHQESRDGDSVKGEYSLIEPDGYIRRVIYTSDPTHGFQATVVYEPPVGALPSSSHNTFSSSKKLPQPSEFPYEEIINSIPDFHDIHIPKYQRVKPKQYDNTNIPYNDHEESKVYNKAFLEPKFYEDTTAILIPNEDNNLPVIDTYSNLEELPTNRVYESTEIANFNTYEPKIEAMSGEYDAFYE